MMAEIQFKKELLERLQAKSESKGLNPNELLEFLLDADDEADKIFSEEFHKESKRMTEEDIKKLLEYDLPEGDQASKNLIGLVDNPIETNAVELKKQSYVRGK